MYVLIFERIIMKKIYSISIVCLLMSMSIFAGPRPSMHVHHRHGPYRHHSHHSHRAATGFLIGAAVGSIVSTALSPTPIVQTVPVVQPTRVWVPGYWMPIQTPNGVINNWVPGHWVVQ